MPVTINEKYSLQQRTASIPGKVFIEREGSNYEYSADEPGFKTRINELLYGCYSNHNFIELFYSVPEIFAPVHEIAKRVSDAVFELCKEWNDEVDYKDELFNKLFSQPNPLVTHRDLVYQAVCYEILCGKNFFFFNKPSLLAGDDFEDILTWSNLPAAGVTADLKKNSDPYTATTMNDFVNFYKVGDRKFDTKNVLPVCHLDLKHPTDINKCQPLIRGADKAIRNLIPVYEARGVIYIKRGALGFLVSRKADETGLISLSKGEKEEAQKEYQGTYGLQNGKNLVGVVSAPVEFVKTAMSIQELQPFDETLADAVAIYATLRVPPHLVPRKDHSTFNNAEADMKNFYSDVIIPWGERYAQIWTSYCNIPRKYIRANYKHINILQENRKEKAQYEKTEGETYLARLLNGVWSLNQWLTAIGEKEVKNNPLYELKIGEMTPEQIVQFKTIINVKATKQDSGSEDKGAEAKSSTNKL